MRSLHETPGHLIRRLQQIAVATFQKEVKAFQADLTPVQYAALRTIADRDGLDQATLAEAIAYDRVTIGGVVARLLAKGLIERRISSADRRARVLSVTGNGRALLRSIAPSVEQAQLLILDPLGEAERIELMRLLRKATSADR